MTPPPLDAIVLDRAVSQDEAWLARNRERIGDLMRTVAEALIRTRPRWRATRLRDGLTLAVVRLLPELLERILRIRAHTRILLESTHSPEALCMTIQSDHDALVLFEVRIAHPPVDDDPDAVGETIQSMARLMRRAAASLMQAEPAARALVERARDLAAHRTATTGEDIAAIPVDAAHRMLVRLPTGDGQSEPIRCVIEGLVVAREDEGPVETMRRVERIVASGTT